MAAGCECSTEVNLNHDDISFVLKVIFLTPSSELLIANSSANFDKFFFFFNNFWMG